MEENAIKRLFEAKAECQNAIISSSWIYISVAQQRLWLFQEGICKKVYACSTSRKPPSCQYGSLGTPLGLHRIAEKIGAGEPLGTIFEKRESLGQRYGVEQTQEGSKGLITSRILWLDGLEEGKNRGYECGSHNRKIYIHGTNLETLIGQPKSMGCVEMNNEHIGELFERVNVDDLVLID